MIFAVENDKIYVGQGIEICYKPCKIKSFVNYDEVKNIVQVHFEISNKIKRVKSG